jgi:hypothetical protein
VGFALQPSIIDRFGVIDQIPLLLDRLMGKPARPIASHIGNEWPTASTHFE